MSKRRYIIRYRNPIMKPVPYDRFHSKVGSNIGNLVYTAGIMRALMVDRDTDFVSTPTGFVCSDKEIDEYNQTCDAFILNLADAIRKSNVKILENMTAFIKKLTIPCIIIGCGLSAPFEPGEDFHYEFDDVVRDFFSAVLEKSGIIGLRGEITAAYAVRLGFREEKDFTVIGCPSMYMYGEELPYRDTWQRLTDDQAKVSLNVSQAVSPHTMELLMRAGERYPNAVYLPQNSDDCILAYYGVPTDNAKKNRTENWPVSLEHPFFKDHEVCIFNHPLSWIEYQKGRDFSTGTRLHGNVTAVLAGTPALFLPQVARTRELCEYHCFAHLTPDQLEKADSILEAAKMVDFGSPVRRQRETFPHYVDFLKQNSLPNIFESGVTDAPFDNETRKFHDLPPMVPINRAGPWEAKKRRKEWENRG